MKQNQDSCSLEQRTSGQCSKGVTTPIRVNAHNVITTGPEQTAAYFNECVDECAHLREQVAKLAADVVEFGSQVLTQHVSDLGETPKNKPYHDAIRNSIAQARAALGGVK